MLNHRAPLRALLFPVMLIVSTSAFAADVFLLRANAPGPAVGCAGSQWEDRTLLHNTLGTTASARLVKVSDGAPPSTAPSTIEIAPGTFTRLPLQWRPDTTEARFWVAHLDVPAGVQVSSSLEFLAVDAPCVIIQPYRIATGSVALPVHTRPVTGSVVHPGADLGDRDAQVSVLVYNAGDHVAAAVQVELRRTCDNQMLATRTASIAPNSLAVLEPMPTGERTTCDRAPAIFNYERHVVVRADQPTLSYVLITAPTYDDGATVLPKIDFTVPLSMSVLPAARRRAVVQTAPNEQQ